MALAMFTSSKPDRQKWLGRDSGVGLKISVTFWFTLEIQYYYYYFEVLASPWMKCKPTNKINK